VAANAAVSSLERLLTRDGIITIAGLFALWALTCTYVVAGAGLGMSAWAMTQLALLPYQSGAMPASAMSSMPGMDMDSMAPAWDSGHWALMIAMWWTMMVAMMTPSAAPTILLYARVHRKAQFQGQLMATGRSTAAFVAGYFFVWLMFSIAATALHALLESAGIVPASTMGSQVRWLSGATLVVTGLYQLSPLKNTCLSHCRAPAQFLSRHWRPGSRGAFRLGLLHGGYCIGCCWMLMALLFVGGVMNLAWIAALSFLVLAEKVLAAGRWVGYCAGVVLVAWGALILLH
jgi:predicted metal-binding membrane protein